MPTSIALSTHFETFIRKQIESGRYNNASEVVRAGLRLLEDTEFEQSVQLDKLRQAITDGKSNGQVMEAAPVFKRLHAKYEKQGKNKAD